jgi:hypothetical protein
MSAERKAPASKLAPLLRDLMQGDLLTLGAVSIVGRGNTPTVAAAGGSPPAEQIWSVTVESELGWYVIVSGVCDIVRGPAVEPCIAVAPINTVPKARYQQLRSGEYSPREFPLPASDVAQIVGADVDDFWPVADLRYVSSVDKHALLYDHVQSRRPLTGPQQRRFSTWVGRRYNRPVHSDELETHVMGKAGDKISKLAAQFAGAGKPGSLPLEVRLVGAAREWLIGGTERAIRILVVIDARSAQAAGLYNIADSAIDESQVISAQKKLASTLRGTLPPDSGYALNVEAITLDGISAAEYLGLEPWLWADRLDPLADDVTPA